ncbi:hypothetical protein BU17DRAFT_62360 [Hysterangium stoloniferum]|nr:hypothetical protein BU17DRAFT_62360 [Hysterangium stoloniferum]
MSEVQKTPSWQEFSSLSRIVIFGDSYSDVGYTLRRDTPRPTLEEPLGIKFPGFPYDGGCNWVGYVAREYSQSPLLIYDYAQCGQTTHALKHQFNLFKQQNFKGDILPLPLWKAESSLFVTWMGINDLGMRCRYLYNPSDDIKGAQKRIFKLQDELYSLGARNFLIIDMPPIHRTPALASVGSSASSLKQQYEDWNTLLRPRLKEFATSRDDATVFLFSSWDIFNKILDNPKSYGFSESDPQERGGGIWRDHLHPTDPVHKIIAAEVSKLLASEASGLPIVFSTP